MPNANNNFCYDSISPPMKAAVFGVRRKARFIEGFDPITELRSVLIDFFGDREELETTGLRVKYLELLNWIRENKAIGLIILGADPNNYPRLYRDLIVKYTTQAYIKIDLTMSGICQYLLQDYIGNDNIKELCEATHCYADYLRNVLENSNFSS